MTYTLLGFVLTMKKGTGKEGEPEVVQKCALVREMLEANIYAAVGNKRETDCAMSILDQYSFFHH